MPMFLAGCDYNEEDINQHLAKKEKLKDIDRSKWMSTSLQPVKSWKKNR